MQNRRFIVDAHMRPPSPSPSPSPPGIRGLGRDHLKVENYRLLHSYRSINPVRTKTDQIRPFAPSPTRDPQEQQRYANAITEENWRFGFVSNVVTEPVRVWDIGSVKRSGCFDYNGERERHVKNLSQYNESLSRNDLNFTRFTNVNAYEKLGSACGNTNYASYVGDRNVVPKSMEIDYGSSRIYTSYRNEPTGCKDYGVVGTRIVSSSSELDAIGNGLNLIGSSSCMSNHGIRECVKEENKKMDNNAFFRGRCADVYKGSQELDQEEEFDCGNDDHVNGGMRMRGVCSEPKNLRFVKSNEFERGEDVVFRGEGVKSPVNYGDLYFSASSPQQPIDAEEPWGYDRVDSLAKGDYYMDMDSTRHHDYKRNDIVENHDKFYGDEGWNEEIEEMQLNNLAARHDQSRKDERRMYGMSSHGNSDSEDDFSLGYLPVYAPRQLHSPVKPFKGDVKKRLGPTRNVKQRLGPLNARRSLGVVPKIGKQLPWMKMAKEKNVERFDRSGIGQNVKFAKVKENKKKHRKVKLPEEDYVDKNVKENSKKHREEELLEEDYVDKKNKKQVKTEPPEDSMEFMQLVQCAFFNYVRTLNENSAIRKKYLEQQGTNTLKCSVCGSFKEFSGTLSLAQHSFSSCKVGYRSEHLGFHKALCALMGWRGPEVPNGLWVAKSLPDAEALSLKEDLIIWPPVVLIHNSSIANDNANHRKTISSQELRDILRGKGFDQSITNVCRGKAANQSILVACFSGTFSGLKHAESLHDFYIENKHGRAEFQQIGLPSCNTIDKQTRAADKVDNILYGYLGTAFDLDKLDFEIKKRCVVKSKKEIKAIADAPMKE